MLEVASLGKVYANGTRALENVSLRIEAGEIVAIVGGSGCGKSTMLRLLSGLDRPTTGQVEVDGEIIDAPHPFVSIVFQEPRLLPWLTVADNIAFGLADLPRHERLERVEEALHRIGLQGYGSRWPRELSGGQGQRVAIARALVQQPHVLLLDEPFSALDAFLRAELQEHLLDLWAETKPTMVVVTHDIEEALVLASRVVVMRPQPGRIAALFDIKLPRPRDRLSHEFEETKREILLELRATLSNSKAA